MTEDSSVNIDFVFIEEALRNPNLCIITVIYAVFTSAAILFLYFTWAVVTDHSIYLKWTEKYISKCLQRKKNRRKQNEENSPSFNENKKGMCLL